MSNNKENLKIEEENELKDIWAMFKDSPDDIQSKRQQVTQIIHENNISSFPSGMSVMTSLDELLLCFALGGQLKNYYRYGSYSPCKREREKFWFAIKYGSFSDISNNEIIDESSLSEKDIEKRHKVQNFYKQRLLEDKARGSSEDIWDIREKS